MSCDDVLKLSDLETAKKHDNFHTEVITGKSLATGENIDHATNAVTGQVQKTLPRAINELGGMGYARVGTFATGATLTTARQTLLWDIADGGDGQEYGWSGAFQKVVPANSTPDSTGGIGEGKWLSRFDPELRDYVLNATSATFKNEYGHSAFENMIAGRVNGIDGVVEHEVGNIYRTGGTVWVVVSSGGVPLDGGMFARPLGDVNVVDFGAVPNDSSVASENANALAFNTALANLVAIRGGTVRIPAGTYYFGDSGYIRWGYSEFASAGLGAVNLIGDGMDSVRLVTRLEESLNTTNKIPAPANFSEIHDGITKSCFLWADRIDNVRISNFSVHMTAGRFFGVQVTGDGCIIDSVLVDGGMRLPSPVASAATICAVQASNCAITNCVDINGYDQGFYILRSTKIRLTGCRSINQRVASFVIYGSTDCQINGCYVDGCSQAVTALSSDPNSRGGLQIEPHRLSVTSNTFMNCGVGGELFGAGINISNEPYGLGYTSIINNPIVKGNIISFGETDISILDGVNIGYCNEAIVSDNQLIAPRRFGINIYNSNWSLVANNIIKNSGNSGIKIYGGIGTHSVSDNIINSPSRLTSSGYGIEAQSSNVVGNSVVIPNSESKTALFDHGGSCFIANSVKGDSANYNLAWMYQNSIVSRHARAELCLSVTTSAVATTATQVAEIKSTSGGFATYMIDLDVRSGGNNKPSRYVLVARGYSGGWDYIELKPVIELTAPATKIVAAISGESIIISGTQTNTASMSVEVKSVVGSLKVM